MKRVWSFVLAMGEISFVFAPYEMFGGSAETLVENYLQLLTSLHP